MGREEGQAHRRPGPEPAAPAGAVFALEAEHRVREESAGNPDPGSAAANGAAAGTEEAGVKKKSPGSMIPGLLPFSGSYASALPVSGTETRTFFSRMRLPSPGRRRREHR